MIRHKSKRKRRNIGKPQKLRITSMMDILTVLLLFLLKSFVAEGEVVTPVPGVELPVSASKDQPVATLVVAVSETDILLGSELISTVREVIEGTGMKIEPLAARLAEAKEKQDEIAALRGTPNDDSEGQITIQGDREIPFQVLQKVMYTCQQSGFASISLAVIKI